MGEPRRFGPKHPAPKLPLPHRGPHPPCLAELQRLVTAHVHHVPFENLDIHLGVPIVLDIEHIYNKVVRQHRGGFCFELNPLFGELLRTLGYDVDLLAAQTFSSGGEVGFEGDHAALRVWVGDEAYLVDVGYGDGPRVPMRLRDGSMARSAGTTFAIAERPEGWILRAARVDGTVRGYLARPQPQRLVDFDAACHYHQHSARSLFTKAPLATLGRPQGRITLHGETLVEEWHHQRVVRRVSRRAYLRTLGQELGIPLTELPQPRGDELGMRLGRWVHGWDRRVRSGIKRARSAVDTWIAGSRRPTAWQPQPY